MPPAHMEGNVSDVPLEQPQRLSGPHLEMLRRGSGISDEVIAARGYRTITDPPRALHLPARRAALIR